MSPMICPLSEFLAPLGISIKVHPLGARNRSSFSIANEFAKRRKASSKVQKPIFCTWWRNQHFIFSTKHFIGGIGGNCSFMHKESRCSWKYLSCYLRVRYIWLKREKHNIYTTKTTYFQASLSHDLLRALQDSNLGSSSKELRLGSVSVRLLSLLATNGKRRCCIYMLNDLLDIASSPMVTGW